MLKTVKVPQQFEDAFANAEKYVSEYFDRLNLKPEDGTVEIEGERYILIRASSMSINFLEFIKNMYPGLSECDAIDASSRVLFEMAKSFGASDAKNFHEKTHVNDPIEKLSTGPIHFAYSGWANVQIDSSSNPTPDDEYYLLYDHPNTFEAHSWLNKHGQTDFCTCFMNAGYSTGWCEESFDIKLSAEEITCRAKGDKNCRFIMARPHRLEEFVKKYKTEHPELFD